MSDKEWVVIEDWNDALSTLDLISNIDVSDSRHSSVLVRSVVDGRLVFRIRGV